MQHTSLLKKDVRMLHSRPTMQTPSLPCQMPNDKPFSYNVQSISQLDRSVRIKFPCLIWYLSRKYILVASR